MARFARCALRASLSGLRAPHAPFICDRFRLRHIDRTSQAIFFRGFAEPVGIVCFLATVSSPAGTGAAGNVFARWVRLGVIKSVAESWERAAMDDLCRYVDRPFVFIFRYVRQHPIGHSIIIATVCTAVACSVTTQYGVKYLVDVLAGGPAAASRIWGAFALLVGLIAADNILWRLAGWIASFTFVRVTGDLRRDLFRHLTGHSPSYFADRLPGMLTSRVTATS